MSYGFGESSRHATILGVTGSMPRAMGRSRLFLALAAAYLGVLVVPFLAKPIHIDDANFLALARGAALDAWRPHAIQINWTGTAQSAFDVLSNPPGIGWWLAPVHASPVWVMHLWMLPWLALALWGCHRLGTATVGDGWSTVALIATAPVFVLGSHSLFPDLPLLACTLAGLAGVLGKEERPWAWALLGGSAALFRYSGICLVPLLGLAAWIRHRRLSVVLGTLLSAALPILLLQLHDLHAYGRSHFWAMVRFQSDPLHGTPVEHKAATLLAGLGGAALLPWLSLQRRNPWPTLIGAVAGTALGAWQGIIWGQTAPQLAMTIACCAAGGSAWGLLRPRSRTDWLPLCWAAGGFLFLLTLRFAATRYWMPFFPAFVLAALAGKPSRLRIATAVTLNALLALGMAIDDQAFAEAQRSAARQVAQRWPAGTFSGHWGWQYYLEEAGWTLVEEGGEVGEIHALSSHAWPSPWRDTCLNPIASFGMPDRWPGPRVHTEAGAANYHASDLLRTRGMMMATFSPWTLADDDYDLIRVFERCRPR